MLTAANWPFTYAGLPPSELFCLSTSKTSLFFTLSWLWTSVCSGIAETTDLSAQFKCHPLLSTLHQCPFTVCLSLCVSRTTKEGIWHLCIFWVFVPHSEPGGWPEDSLCSPFHPVLHQYGSNRIVLPLCKLGGRIAEQRSAKSKNICWQTRPRTRPILMQDWILPLISWSHGDTGSVVLCGTGIWPPDPEAEMNAPACAWCESLIAALDWALLSAQFTTVKTIKHVQRRNNRLPKSIQLSAQCFPLIDICPLAHSSSGLHSAGYGPASLFLLFFLRSFIHSYSLWCKF